MDHVHEPAPSTTPVVLAHAAVFSGDFKPESVAAYYRQTFAARFDAFADWDDRAHDPADHHWTAVRSEMTVGRVLQALTEPRPISSYMEDASGLTHVGAIDFDRDDGWELAMQVAEKLLLAGAYPALERSRRGGHLWIVMDGRTFGDTVRRALRSFVEQARPGSGKDPKVEILPKRIEHRGPDTLGFALRLPMMAHQRTGKRYPLCDPGGNPLGPTVTSSLFAVRWTPMAVIEEAAAAAKVPASEIHVPVWARPAVRQAGDVVSILTASGVDRAAPNRTVRCPLHDDKHASMSIATDGERVWCKNPECSGNNSGRGLGADQLTKALAVIG